MQIGTLKTLIISNNLRHFCDNASDYEFNELRKGGKKYIFHVNHAKHMKILWELGLDINIVNEHGDNILMRNIFNVSCDFEQYYDIAKFFVKNGGNLNHKNKKGNTALMLLIKHYLGNNLPEIIELLIKNKANINIKNNLGETAIKLNNQNYNDERVKKILDEQIDKEYQYLYTYWVIFYSDSYFTSLDNFLGQNIMQYIKSPY